MTYSTGGAPIRFQIPSGAEAPPGRSPTELQYIAILIQLPFRLISLLLLFLYLIIAQRLTR